LQEHSVLQEKRSRVLQVLNATAQPVTIRRFTKLVTISTYSISTIQPFVRPKQPEEEEKIKNQNPEILDKFAKNMDFK